MLVCETYLLSCLWEESNNNLLQFLNMKITNSFNYFSRGEIVPSFKTGLIDAPKDSKTASFLCGEERNIKLHFTLFIKHHAILVLEPSIAPL